MTTRQPQDEYDNPVDVPLSQQVARNAKRVHDGFGCIIVQSERDEIGGGVRTFDTGATRDTDEGKPEHWGFSSALVEKRFGEYMHQHRVQSDGSLRASDNWKRGIPVDSYRHSLSRHLNDLRLIQEGYLKEATDPDLESVLCAIKFNVDGMLYEVLKESK